MEVETILVYKYRSKTSLVLLKAPHWSSCWCFKWNFWNYANVSFNDTGSSLHYGVKNVGILLTSNHGSLAATITGHYLVVLQFIVLTVAELFERNPGAHAKPLTSDLSPLHYISGAALSCF